MPDREIKMGANLRRLCAGLLAAVSLFSTSASAKVASSSEQALRERADQLYGSLQRGDWRQAEKYVTKESKAVFRNLSRKPVTAYEIQSAKLDEGGETGVVVVQIPVFSGSPHGPIRVPETTHWRLIGGSWYLQLSSSHSTGSPPGIAGSRTPPSSLLAPPRSKDLKFESTRISVGYVHADEVKVARFAATNASQHTVTVGVGQTSCDCLRMKSQQREFKAGEVGVIEIELDSSTLKVDSPQPFTFTMLLATEPEHALTELTILAVVVPDSTGAASVPSPPTGRLPPAIKP